MFVRMSTSGNVTDVNAIVDQLANHVLPAIQGQHGYRGLTASANRADGIVSVLTIWESEADLKASEALANEVRRKATESTGGVIQQVQVYEQMVQEIGGSPPALGCPLLIRPIKMDPDKIDDNVAFFRANVLAQITSAPGFRAIRNMIDRLSGEGMVGTVWDDVASLEASQLQFEQTRPLAEARGIEFGTPLRREIIFVNFV
jgi:heme-degrading monooxygenase HmoA